MLTDDNIKELLAASDTGSPSENSLVKELRKFALVGVHTLNGEALVSDDQRCVMVHNMHSAPKTITQVFNDLQKANLRVIGAKLTFARGHVDRDLTGFQLGQDHLLISQDRNGKVQELYLGSNAEPEHYLNEFEAVEKSGSDEEPDFI